MASTNGNGHPRLRPRQDHGRRYRIFFQGVVADEPQASVTLERKQLFLVKLAGPWFWFRELYLPELHWVNGYINPEFPYRGRYNYTTVFLTQFSCNRDPFTNNLRLPPADQICARLPRRQRASRSSASCSFDYGLRTMPGMPTDISALLVLPVDMLNVTADEVIRRQFVNYNMVYGFDHSVSPPLFFYRRAQDCPVITLTTLARVPDTTGLMPDAYNLQRARPAARCPLSASPSSTSTPASSASPTRSGRPAPISMRSSASPPPYVPLSSNFPPPPTPLNMLTTTVTPNNIAWWQGCFFNDPRFGDGSEFADLAVVTGTVTRDFPGLPRMIASTAATFLTGCRAPSTATASAPSSPIRSESTASSPARSARREVQHHGGLATDMNYPTETQIGTINVTSFAETLPISSRDLAQLVWQDLNTPNWVGEIAPRHREEIQRHHHHRQRRATISPARARIADWQAMAAPSIHRRHPAQRWHRLRHHLVPQCVPERRIASCSASRPNAWRACNNAIQLTGGLAARVGANPPVWPSSPARTRPTTIPRSPIICIILQGGDGSGVRVWSQTPTLAEGTHIMEFFNGDGTPKLDDDIRAVRKLSDLDYCKTKFRWVAGCKINGGGYFKMKVETSDYEDCSQEEALAIIANNGDLPRLTMFGKLLHEILQVR